MNPILEAINNGVEVNLLVWQDDVETDVSLNVGGKSYWDYDDPTDCAMLEAFHEAEDAGLIEPIDSIKGYGIYKLSDKKE